MPAVGDRVRFASRKIDEAPREGVVTGATGGLLRIKWSTGEESTVSPGPGAIAVVGKLQTSSGKKATAGAKAAKKVTKRSTR